MVSIVRLGVLVAAVVIAVPLPAQDSRIHGEFSRSVVVNGTVSLRLSNPNGDTTVRVGPDDEVQIRGTISAGTRWDCNREESQRKVARFERNHAFESDGGRIRIGYWADPEMNHCTSIEYELLVPAETTLRIEQLHGNIKIYDVVAPIEVDIENAGQVRIKDPGASVRVESAIGGISVDGDPKSDWVLRTGLGGVELRLPQDAGFNVDAEVSEGSIETDFAMGSGARAEMDRLRGAANGGGPLLRIRANMGSIAILER